TSNPDGSFSYTPATNFFGTDTFTYQANNGHVSGTAQTVTVTVNQINHAPVAVDDLYTTRAGQPPLTVTAANGLLPNDTDSNDDPLTAVLVANPAHGKLVFNTDGSFTYTPNAGFSGTDSFTYRAYDAQALSNVATVSLTVNHAPTPAVRGDYDGDGKADV